ncbi:hypothetical protein JM658_12685 [Joostella atrarenae]|uniref:Uncharacterized protein n=1 Tax=Joostella atrarenae TaxID=679257 RepID=A0ABS9J5J8_9FLAO|nr:hypothetical protein [Joostella atrarenae]MCF8715684.1 hypothetical protein [Joostella atrarenae]
MFSIFKNKVIPKLNITLLEPSEGKALLDILGLMDCEKSILYKNLENSITNKNCNSIFSESLAKQIYYHPEIYANEKEGLEFIASWLPLLENGFYPDKKSSYKLTDFLYFSLSFLQSEDISENLRDQIFTVIKKLVHSESEASLPITRFLIHRAFDIRDYLSSDFIIQQCLKHTILNETYAVVNSSKEATKHSFKINNDFIKHFFNDDWHEFITALHQILPVGKTYLLGAYNLIQPWLSENLATFYNDNLEYAFAAHKALQERLVFVEEESIDLLNIKTANGIYPLITSLGLKEWNAGDVLLFNNRNKDIPTIQLEKCYLKFLDWLNADGGSNFFTEAFQDNGKHILEDINTSIIPIDFLPFWFEKCNQKSGNPEQVKLYNTIFSGYLKGFQTGSLPIVFHEGKEFQVTGVFIIRDLFKINSSLKNWLDHFKEFGINDPLNQFLVLSFYDARASLLELFDQEDQETLYKYLIEMAYTARNTSEDIKVNSLTLIVETLAGLCEQTEKFNIVNEVWALKNIDSCISTACNEFARTHYINENRPLSLNHIESWYNFLSDYYYSARREAVWVSAVLKTQGTRTANHFNAIEDDISFFLNKTFNRLLVLHQKSTIKGEHIKALATVGTEIEKYLKDLLQQLNKEKLAKPIVQSLYEYNNASEVNFSNNKQLQAIVNEFYDYHFQQEIEKETIVVEEKKEKLETDISSFEINQKYIEMLLNNLENYKQTNDYEIELLTAFNENTSQLKIWFEEHPAIEMQLNQALYMTLLDADLAPGTTLETYGNLCRNLFVSVAKNTKMASSYELGLKAMANSGAYSKELTTALLEVVNDLNT